MTAKEIGAALAAHCRAGSEAEGLATLYAADCRSIEAVDNGGGRVAEGIEAIRGKHAWWEENFTVHASQVDGPFDHGDDRFALIFDVDATDNTTGARNKMREVGIYTVAGGKIVEEAFYYAT